MKAREQLAAPKPSAWRVLVLGERWTVRETVLAVVGSIAMVGAAVFGVLGLLTPKAPRATA